MSAEFSGLAADDPRFREGRRITWVSVGVNACLTAMQVVVGVIAH